MRAMIKHMETRRGLLFFLAYLRLNLMRIITPKPPLLFPPSNTWAQSLDKTEELLGCKSTPLNILVSLFKAVKAIKTRVVLEIGCKI